MKKIGFSQFSSILLMLPLKFKAMNTLHSFLDQTVYVLCRKICKYKSYTGMKNRSERKFPCRVKSKILIFAICYTKIGVLSRKPICFSHRIHKNAYKKFWTTLLMPKWKCQCFDRIAREPSNMLKAREQSKKLNYTDRFKTDHITLHGNFLSLQSFILRKLLYSPHVSM